MQTVKCNEKTFNLSMGQENTEMLNGYRRKVITLHLTDTNYTDVASAFVDGASFTIVDEQGTEYQKTDYTSAGAITDNRDGNVVVKMGKANTQEQDLQDQVNKANATVTELAGKPVESEQEAQEIRAQIEQAAAMMDDQEAAKTPSLSKPWEVGEGVKVGDRRYYAPKLYKCRQAHTTQANWTPDRYPAGWVVIDIEHAGTKEDPIPASAGMEYEYGKYYLDPDDGKTYLCKRTGEASGGKIVLHFFPHELIGQYFELA